MSAGLAYVPGILSLVVGLIWGLATGSATPALIGLGAGVINLVLLMLYAVSDWRSR